MRYFENVTSCKPAHRLARGSGRQIDRCCTRKRTVKVLSRHSRIIPMSPYSAHAPNCHAHITPKLRPTAARPNSLSHQREAGGCPGALTLGREARTAHMKAVCPWFHGQISRSRRHFCHCGDGDAKKPQQAGRLTAKPPRLVSLKFELIASPVWRIARMQLSSGM